MEQIVKQYLKILPLILLFPVLMACNDGEVEPHENDKVEFRIDTVFMNEHWSTEISDMPPLEPLVFSEFIQLDENQMLVVHQYNRYSNVYTINTTDGSLIWVQKFYIQNVHQVELTNTGLLLLAPNSYFLVNPNNGELLREVNFSDIPTIEGFCFGNKYYDGNLILNCSHNGNAVAITHDLQTEETIFLIETDIPLKEGYRKKIPMQGEWAYTLFKDQEEVWRLFSFHTSTGDYRIVDVDPEYNHLFSRNLIYRNMEMDDNHLYINYGAQSELVALDFETGNAVWDLPAEWVRKVDGSLFGVQFIFKKLEPLSGAASWSNNAGWSGIFPYGMFPTNNSQQLVTFSGSLNIIDRASGDYVRLFQANQTALDKGWVQGIFWDRNNSYFLKHGISADGTYTIMSLDAPWVE